MGTACAIVPSAMRIPAVGAMALLALLVGLAPLAYASPPDQTWLPGLYDNADYDDAVLALTSTVAASDGTPAPRPGPAAVMRRTLGVAKPAAPEPAGRPPYHLRAPPLA